LPLPFFPPSPDPEGKQPRLVASVFLHFPWFFRPAAGPFHCWAVMVFKRWFGACGEGAWCGGTEGELELGSGRSDSNFSNFKFARGPLFRSELDLKCYCRAGFCPRTPPAGVYVTVLCVPGCWWMQGRSGGGGKNGGD
jgi:hypothetical protein